LVWRPVLAWAPSSPDASLELPFTVDEAGRYALRLTASVREQGGRYAELFELQAAGYR